MICDNHKDKVSSIISARNRSAWLAHMLAREPPSTKGKGAANDSKPSNYPPLFSNWLSINKIIIFKKNLTFFIIQNHRRPFFSIRKSCCFFSYYPFDLSKADPLFTEPMPKQDKHPALLCFVFAPISWGLTGASVSYPSVSIDCTLFMFMGDDFPFGSFLSLFWVLLRDMLLWSLSWGKLVFVLLPYVSRMVSYFFIFLLFSRCLSITGSKWTWDEFEISPLVMFITSSSSPYLVP